MRLTSRRMLLRAIGVLGNDVNCLTGSEFNTPVRFLLPVTTEVFVVLTFLALLLNILVTIRRMIGLVTGLFTRLVIESPRSSGTCIALLVILIAVAVCRL